MSVFLWTRYPCSAQHECQREKSQERCVQLRGQIEYLHPLQGYLAHQKQPPPSQDHLRALGIGLLQVARMRWFLMNEVPL